MPLPKRLLAWLPPKDKTVELFVVGIFGTAVVLYLAYEESKNLEALRFLTSDIIRLDHEVTDMAHDQAAPGIVAGLLSFLRCDNPPEVRQSAVALLHRISPSDLDKEMKPVLDACPAGNSAIGDAASDASERDFIRGVTYGRDFYRDRLWQAAAEEWHSAANKAPPSYLRKVAAMNYLKAATVAYDAKDYLTAADSYVQAYSNVPSVR